MLKKALFLLNLVDTWLRNNLLFQRTVYHHKTTIKLKAKIMKETKNEIATQKYKIDSQTTIERTYTMQSNTRMYYKYKEDFKFTKTTIGDEQKSRIQIDIKSQAIESIEQRRNTVPQFKKNKFWILVWLIKDQLLQIIERVINFIGG